MCLRILSNSEALIAENDIECYKIILKKKHTFFPKYFTLARHAEIQLSEEYTSEFEFGSETRFIPRLGHSVTKRTIEKGLHSFTNLREAKSFCQTDVSDESYKYYIVKCIIPKNSKYYIGRFNDVEGYASDRIKYTKEIVYDLYEHLKVINKFFDEVLNS